MISGKGVLLSKVRLSKSVIYLISVVLVSLLWNLWVNSRSDYIPIEVYVRSAVFSTLLFLFPAIAIYLWGTTRIKTVCLSTGFAVGLQLVSFSLLQASRGNFGAPLFLIFLGVALIVIINLIAVAPILIFWTKLETTRSKQA